MTSAETIETAEEKEMKEKMKGKTGAPAAAAAESSAAPTEQSAETEEHSAPAGPQLITAYNAPDARDLMQPPSKGAHTEKGHDVDVWGL